MTVRRMDAGPSSERDGEVGLLRNMLAAIMPTITPMKQHTIPHHHSADRGLSSAGALAARAASGMFSVSSISITASPISRSRRRGSFSKQRRSRDLMFAGVFYLRYKSGKWKTIKVISYEEEIIPPRSDFHETPDL